MVGILLESTITGHTALTVHIVHTDQATRVTLLIIRAQQQRGRLHHLQPHLQAVALPPRQAERLRHQTHLLRFIRVPTILM